MWGKTSRLIAATALFCAALSLAACGGGGHGGSKSKSYTVGGTLSGLGSGLSVTLVNNGTDSLTRSTNGTFTFGNQIKTGVAYAVTVGAQPTGQTCSVSGGSGTVDKENVTTVTVTCSDIPKYAVGGTVSGLGTGLSVTLLNNGGNSLVRSADGAFAFTTSLAAGSAYAVTVGTQPVGQTCTVANGTGTIGSANVTNLAVTCANVPKYHVGGTVSGLATGRSVTLLDNGGDSLVRSSNGTFVFVTTIASGSAYSVTVGTQPTGQTCSVSNGSGTIASADVTNVGVACVDNDSNSWNWRGGSKLAAPTGVYGTLGVPAASNAPGGRNWNGSWSDGSGSFWIFGGQGYDSAHAASALNDLWKYDATTGYWTWMGGSTTINAAGVYGTKGVGSTTNIPGAREFMATWVGDDGKFWLFGGYGFDGAGHRGYLNDLWNYDPNTGLWTWVDGPNAVDTAGVYGTKGVESAGNLPGARYGAVAWNVMDGYVWLFGGYGVDANGAQLGYMNDLWRYNPANGQWTWMSGSNAWGQLGVYGTKGLAAAGNTPGMRASTLAVGIWWEGSIYLFGGLYADAGSNLYLYNDVWRYDTGAHLWAWLGGSNVTNVTGVYGTKGTPSVANAPGSRGGAVGWYDSYGRILVFGGMGYDSAGMTTATNPNLNDLWQFDTQTTEWTWLNGSNVARAAGVYGTLGTPSPTVQPGARDSGTVWEGVNGHMWLFGGAGYDSNGTYDSYGMNDLFEYIP